MTATASSAFRPLTAGGCEERLARHRVGRVAWAAADGPMVLPVSHQLHLGRISFRTSAYGALSRLVDPTDVAFEVDEIDLGTGTGWSVLVRGRARAVTSSYELSTLWRLEGAVPWASGSRTLVISVEPRTTTGRLVAAPPR